jgi:TolB-like protein
VRGRRFLVLPFRNVSRSEEHAWLVEGSPILLADALSRWQEITVVSDERLYPALRRHGLVPGTVMDLARVRRVAEETGGWTAVTGEILSLGGRVRVSARAYDVVTGRELVRAFEEVVSGADVRRAYERIGARLLRAAGVEAGELSLDAATTSSLDAYRAYLRGIAHLRRSEARRARDAFEEAVRLDSTFAQAHMKLAEARLGVNPLEMFDAQSPALHHAGRAAALADRLSPRQRSLATAVNDVFRGRFTAGRTSLDNLLAADSNDADALEWMSGLNSFDPLLVPAPGGGERPRGSPDAALRQAKRVLELDAARHQMYQTLVFAYAQAGGYPPGVLMGLRREPPSLVAMFQSVPTRIYAIVFRDSLELVPAESLATITDDTLEASRRRALEVAIAWTRRWREAGPAEAEAHLWAARVFELRGELDSALRELDIADSLGVETGLEVVPVRRMALLTQSGRYDSARRIADSLWAAGDYDSSRAHILRLESAAWAFHLFLLAAEDARADYLLRLASRLVAGFSPALAPELGGVILLSGRVPYGVPFRLTSTQAVALGESLLRRLGGRPPEGAVAAWVMPLLSALEGDNPPEARRLNRTLALAAGDSAAAHGDLTLAYELARFEMGDGSSRLAELRSRSWYVERDLAYRRAAAATQRRFAPEAARLEGDSLIVEWRVAGGDTATWNRPTARPGRGEYTWAADVSTGGYGYEVRVTYLRSVRQAQRTGSLAELAASAVRTLAEHPLADTTRRRLRLDALIIPEARPGLLRIVVRAPGLADSVRRERPSGVRFRFLPCVQDPDDPATRCVDQMVAIEYR